MFFAQITGWQYHPGNKNPKTIRECAEIADQMMVEYEIVEKSAGLELTRRAN